MQVTRTITLIALVAGYLHFAGTASIDRQELAAEATVQLPPFLVQGQTISWFYGELPGLCVLSACSRDVTKGFVGRYLRSKAEFAALVPEKFRQNEPELLILVPPKHAKTISREMSGLMHDVSNSAPTIAHLRVSGGDLTATYLIVDPDVQSEAPAPDRANPFGFRKWDSEVVDDRLPDYLRFTLSAEYVDYQLLARRSGMLPCIVSGLAATFEATAETAGGVASLPDTWLSMDDWRAVRRDPEAPRPLLPIEEVLRGPPPSSKDPRYVRLWHSEAELFVRWALFSDNGKHSEAFWRFALESSRQPLDEQNFQSCFGFDYSDGHDALSDYLPLAAGAPVKWSFPIPDSPSFKIHRADSEEIGWVKGEWNRLVLKAVGRDFPSLLPLYRRQALTILTRALSQGDRSARLVASLALVQAESGDDAAAMNSLEEAVSAGSRRPLVLAELARLRLKRYLEAKSGNNRKLTEAEASDIFSLVQKALESFPLVAEESAVVRAALDHLGRKPTSEELGILDKTNDQRGNDQK